MSSPVRIQIILAVSVCVVLTAGQVVAQRAPKKLNQDFRYLGHFQSAGYHWRTPGPCTGYYNPYSRMNSELRIGGVPQGAEAYVSRLGYGCSNCQNSFDQPSTFQYNSMNPMPGVPSGNKVPSIIDDTKEEDEFDSDDADLESTQSPIDSVSEEDEDLSELEAEVQSILNERKKNSDPNPNEGSGAKGETSYRNLRRGIDYRTSVPKRVPSKKLSGRYTANRHSAWSLWK